MQQTLDFSIEIFDVRTDESIKIKDDRGLVRNIQINKDLQLNNQAVITFAKGKSYSLLNVEEKIKLYNYVKIELTVRNYDPSVNNEFKQGSYSEETFYFSGFIQNVNKQVLYGPTPTAAVSIVIADFANLFKTTFYTKNITFFNILEQAVPEFRLINFQEVFNDPSNKLLDDFYSLNQIGFRFFSFFFFKFLYNIVYKNPGEEKKIGENKIFKQFKIYMPFGFSIIGSSEGIAEKYKSLFDGQVSSLIIYKKLQGVALDIYKYLYPEPIFEFSTYETKDSVILQIRPTPFMCFDRPLKNKISISTAEDVVSEFSSEEVYIQGSVEDVNSFNVIEQDDFGFSRVAKSREEFGSTPAIQIRDHIRPIMDIMNSTIRESKKLDVDTLIPNIEEEREIIAKYFNVIPFDIRFVESINLTRSAQSVVNVVWTTPATDTAVLQTSGRSLVMGLLGDELGKLPGSQNSKFTQYVANQYVTNQSPNPAFFWNYRNTNPDKYVSGDINYFGLREFEVKWNCLTLYDSSAYFILNYVDRKILEKIREQNKSEEWVDVLQNALTNNAQQIDQDKAIGSKKAKKPKQIRNLTPPVDTSIYYKEAFDDRDFKAALKQLATEGFSEADLKSMKQSELPAFIKRLKDKGSNTLGSFAAKLNGVVSKAYRENEHLYDGQILKPIDLVIIPGMIVDSTYPNAPPSLNTPRFRGYITSATHVVDFNAATMKSTFAFTRTASNDSAIVIDRVDQ